MFPATRKPPLRICGTCPWLKVNHRKPHPAKWYSVANLRRLWNGLRSGKAPGMVCHSTDPNSVEYGGTTPVKRVDWDECGGAVLLLTKHMNELNNASVKEYRQRYKYPLTRRAIAKILERFLFGTWRSVENRVDEVGLPFPN